MFRVELHSKGSFPACSPTLTSALVLSVTSMMNSQRLSAGWLIRWCRMNRSTVAPRLSMLDTKMYSFPSAISLSKRPELEKLE